MKIYYKTITICILIFLGFVQPTWAMTEEAEYERLSSFISRHPNGSCSWVKNYGGDYKGDIADQFWPKPNEPFTRKGNTHCTKQLNEQCQLPKYIARLQHLERSIASKQNESKTARENEEADLRIQLMKAQLAALQGGKPSGK